MIVLDMAPYDAILGYDWLKQHSPMKCDWDRKTLEFEHQGQQIKLQGLLPPPLGATSISTTKLYNATKGNDAWAFAIVNTVQPSMSTAAKDSSPVPPAIQQVLQQYAIVFNDPQTLAPARSYDHSIPLTHPRSSTHQCQPYHYSPQLKTEIEDQVK